MTVVLIVDDEKALRDGLSEAVRDLGYEPVVASSGREALAVATQAKPDAALRASSERRGRVAPSSHALGRVCPRRRQNRTRRCSICGCLTWMGCKS